MHALHQILSSNQRNEMGSARHVWGGVRRGSYRVLVKKPDGNSTLED